MKYLEEKADLQKGYKEAKESGKWKKENRVDVEIVLEKERIKKQYTLVIEREKVGRGKRERE